MYELIEWEKAGLDRKSWVYIKRPLILPFTYLVRKKEIGKITQRDAENLMRKYSQYWNNPLLLG